jgi:hypothetical protein
MLGEEKDYCVSCFTNLDEYPSEYHVINKLDYPLYDNEWVAEEELLLFEGLEKYASNDEDMASGIGRRSLISLALARLAKMLKSTI